LAGILGIGFVALTLVSGWWAFWRGPDLVTRTDNARRTISDRHVQRGKILDRNGVPLSITSGLVGDFYRSYPQTSTAHVIGYTNPFFGQTGIEESLDPILRGLEYQSPWKVWTSHLLYGQPPSGRTILISLDSTLQNEISGMMGTASGAVVVLNAQTGEILVLFSSPSFDPNQLLENWDALNESPDAPFLNRSTQGLYPPGPAIGAFLLAETQTKGMLPADISELEINLEGNTLRCATPVELPSTWQQALAAGCPAPLATLGLQLGEEGLTTLFTNLGFYQSPQIQLNTSQPLIPTGFPTPTITAMGQADILISPLQLALAATSLSNGGIIPSPNLLLEVQIEDGEWIAISNEGKEQQAFLPSIAEQTALNLAHPSLPIWETVSYARTTSGQRLTWYMGGTLPVQTTDDRYVTIVLLEKPDPQLALSIGQMALTAVSP
jgi:peptidoglycan glycosyltransferase